MTFVFIGVIAVIIGGGHWYVWRRMVRDVSAPKSTYRRIGTVLIVLLPATLIAFQVTDRAGAPFGLRQVLAWPGFLWLALLLYLFLALLAGELVRPVLTRLLARRSGAADAGAGAAGGGARVPVAVAARTADGEARTADAVAAGTAGPAAAGAAGPAAAGGGDGAGDGRSAGGDGAGGAEGAGGAAELSRRLFVARTVAAGAAAVAVGTVGYGVWAARQLATKHVTVELANLPRSADGYRITVVGDMHLSTTLGRAHCERVVAAVNATDPDIVTMVGDLVDARVEDLRSAVEPLTGLRTREGAFFVTGNHEYYVGSQPWVARVRELGMTVLDNRHQELPSGIDVVGVNDISGEEYEDDGPDLPAALAGRDPRRPCVLLAHQPQQIHEAVEHGVDLVVAGHTHGGQMWPGPIVAGWANPTLAGLERYGDSQLFVTRGAGTWGPPVRVAAEPDITVLTLTPAR